MSAARNDFATPDVDQPRQRPPASALLAAVALALVAVGGILHLAGYDSAAHAVWAATTVGGILPACWLVMQDARRGHLGVDVVALLALVGTLAVGETLAGAVIALMLATGRALEDWAGRRARRELSALLERARHDSRTTTRPKGSSTSTSTTCGRATSSS